MSNGKGDKRLHARTKSPEFPDRWEATFTAPQPHKFAGAKYIAGRGWVVPCEVKPLHQQSGAGRVVCWGGCDGWHDVRELTKPNPPNESP